MKPLGPSLAIWLAAHLAPADTPVVRLTDIHADFRVLYSTAPEPSLTLVVHDADRSVNYRTHEVVLVAREESRLVLPADFPPLGQAGDPLWVLPQSQDPRLLYLGFSGESILPGTLQDAVSLRLRALQGPGEFSVWQAASFGALDVRINTRDGLGDDDAVRVVPGGHEHFNFGFTTNGVYHLTFQAEALDAATGQPISSPPSTFVFEVEPLPSTPVEPPRLSPPLKGPDGLWTVTLQGQVGAPYTLLESPDLQDWQTVTNLVATAIALPVVVPEPGVLLLRAHSP